MIRLVETKDIERITAIYKQYVLTTTITFEEIPPTVDEMAIRVEKGISASCWFVYELDGELVGYAYATLWKERSAYRFARETSVYLAPEHQGKGMGSQLYRELLDTLKKQGVHLVIAGIAQPNEKSNALHEKFGFVKMGEFQEVGYKFDQWISVGYWQMLL